MALGPKQTAVAAAFEFGEAPAMTHVEMWILPEWTVAIETDANSPVLIDPLYGEYTEFGH